MSPPTLCCLLVALEALAVFSCAARAAGGAAVTGSGGAAEAAPAEIARVETWEDLQARPAIRLSSGATVRLGVERARSPRRTSVLVYCLTDGYSTPRGWRESDRLGPLRLRVRREGDAARGEEIRSLAEHAGPEASGRLCFLSAVRLPSAGSYRLEARELGGRLVARGTVVATDEAAQAWLRFAPGPRTLDRPGEEDPFHRLTPRVEGAVLPRWVSSTPMVVDGRRGDRRIKILARGRLPTAVPRAPHSGIRLEVRGEDLLVTTEESIITSRPDWHFIARWWVRGKPVEPSELEALSDMNGLLSTGKRLRLRLAPRAALPGVDPGDRVEVQLLYCRDGCENLAETLELLHAFGGSDGPRLLLSKRVLLPES